MIDRLVSVAVPVPVLGLLTYSVPSGQDMPVPGARVIVPLGPRQLIGVVVGHLSAVDVAFKVKDIVRVLDAEAFVPADVVKLTGWVSDYYLAGPGATLSAALPPRGLANRVARFKTVRVVTLTERGMVRLKADTTAVDVASGFPVRRSPGEGGSRTLPGLGRSKCRPCGCWRMRPMAARCQSWQQQALPLPPFRAWPGSAMLPSATNAWTATPLSMPSARTHPMRADRAGR